MQAMIDELAKQAAESLGQVSSKDFLSFILCVINQSYSSAFLPKSGPTQLAFSVALPCTQSS